MIQPTMHDRTPTAPTVGVQNSLIQLDQSLPQPDRPVNLFARLVNRFRPAPAQTSCPACLAVFDELVASRNLITAADEADARRRAAGLGLVTIPQYLLDELAALGDMPAEDHLIIALAQYLQARPSRVLSGAKSSPMAPKGGQR